MSGRASWSAAAGACGRWVAGVWLAASVALAAAGQQAPQGEPAVVDLQARHDALQAQLLEAPRPRPAERLALLEQFLDQTGDQPTARQVLRARLDHAATLLTVDRSEAAIAEYRQIANDAAGLRERIHAAAVYGLYTAYLAAGQRDLARQALQRVCREFPDTRAERCAQIALAHLDAEPVVAVGAPLPELHPGTSLAGNELTIPSDRPCLLVFWSADHQTSTRRLQALVRAWQQTGRSIDDVITYVAEADTMQLRRLVAQRRWEFPIVAAAESGFLHPDWIELGITSVPAVLLIGEGRVLLARDVPPDRLSALLGDVR